MDLDQQLLDAFQIEHREQLQHIRRLLLEVEDADVAKREQCINEAFRMAHSLKGGARVCDLQPAEAMGHGLETIFAQLREGTLELDDRLTRSINVVLDSIEDWMAALLETETPPEPTEALQTVQGLLCASSASSTPTQPPATGIEQQLKAAFFEEYRRYTDGLQVFLDRASEPDTEEPPDFCEAFCLAHDLRASARAAQLTEVERRAEPLESLFRQLRDGTADFDAELRETVRAALLDIHQHITATENDPTSGSRAATRPDHGSPPAAKRAEGEIAPAPSAGQAESQYETVRVRTESLDRLLQSSSQLLTESMRQDQVTRELGELKQTIEVMQRERESLRRVASASLHCLEQKPEFRHVARYLESADRNLHSLGQHARKLHLKHQHSCWLLRSHGTRIQEDIRQARMVSAHSLFQGFPKMVRDLARDEGKEVDFKVVESDVRVDRMVLQALKDPVMHMLRNCVTHGIEPADRRGTLDKLPQGRITLSMQAIGNQLQITIEDDGAGIDRGRIASIAARQHTAANRPAAGMSQEELTRLLFQPGFSTSSSVTELAGRGMGLSVVEETVKRLQGNVQLFDAEPGTRIVVSVPLSVCTHRLLLVASGEQEFAVPLHAIECLKQLKEKEIETLEGVPVVMHRNQLVPMVSMAGLLELTDRGGIPAGDGVPVLILKLGDQRLAVVVDEFLQERDALVQNLTGAAASAEFAGAILAEDGRAVLVLNPAELFRCEQPKHAPVPESPTQRPEEQPLRVLVVDDSFTTRTLEKSILETHGYQVHVAMDGVEALEKMRAHRYDAVISDLEMPRLDGFELLAEMKQQENLASLPVVLVTSRDCNEDQQRGLELGADAYIVKRKFDHQDLLCTIEQLIAS